MFLIPYSHTVSEVSNFLFHTAWIFTVDGGTAMWETEEKTLSEEQLWESYLHPNGFEGSLYKVENVYFLEVAKESMRFSDFYEWNESLKDRTSVPNTLQLWRPFFWVEEKQKESSSDLWGWEEQAETLSMGSFGSIRRFWDLRRK
jgi:hypothetical protein